MWRKWKTSCHFAWVTYLWIGPRMIFNPKLYSLIDTYTIVHKHLSKRNRKLMMMEIEDNWELPVLNLKFEPLPLLKNGQLPWNNPEIFLNKNRFKKENVPFNTRVKDGFQQSVIEIGKKKQNPKKYRLEHTSLTISNWRENWQPRTQRLREN